MNKMSTFVSLKKKLQSSSQHSLRPSYIQCREQNSISYHNTITTIDVAIYTILASTGSGMTVHNSASLVTKCVILDKLLNLFLHQFPPKRKIITNIL